MKIEKMIQLKALCKHKLQFFLASKIVINVKSIFWKDLILVMLMEKLKWSARFVELSVSVLVNELILYEDEQMDLKTDS